MISKINQTHKCGSDFTKMDTAQEFHGYESSFMVHHLQIRANWFKAIRFRWIQVHLAVSELILGSKLNWDPIKIWFDDYTEMSGLIM